jgi:NADPH:quinone reductase-like Zn-dependent oxidoreductase
MKAIVYEQYGLPEVLQLKEVAPPVPKENEILIRVRATSVGYGDITARNFKNISPREFNMALPLWWAARLAFGPQKPNIRILGAEFSGTVEAVGHSVTRFTKGEAVFGYRGQAFGANAEFLCMPETGLVAPKPANLSFEEASTVPYGAMTALSLLRQVNIQPGQRVLINGASGGIGSYAVQLAKHYGAHVTGICSTPRMSLVKALGADEVINYVKTDFTQNGQKYNVIFDVLGRSSFAKCKRSLTANGRYLLASFKTPQLLQMLITSFFGGPKVICALSNESLADLLHIKALAEAGKIKAFVDKRFPLAQAAAAHRYWEAGQRTGSVVLTLL